MHYWAFVSRRVLIAVPLVLGTVVVTFLMIQFAPGDPALLLAGDAPTPEFLAAIRERYGLDDPLHVQLGSYLAQAASGDLGESIYFSRPVVEVITERVPNTLLITLAAIPIAVFIGTLLGTWAAARKDTWVDSAVSGAALMGYSTPIFWLAQLLVLVFAVWAGLLPASGMVTSRVDYTGWAYYWDLAKHMVLPVASLAIFEMGLITRFTRTAMVENLESDYVFLAHAKGLKRRKVLFRHALRNALLVTITVVGFEFGVLLAGAVVTETVYAWPGIGRLFFDAISRRDFPLLSGLFIFTSAMVVLVNLLTDMIYAVLDPRVYR